MNKFFYVLGLVVLFGCHNYKKDVINLQNQNDSLLSITKQKDQVVIDYVKAFNEIQDNLTKIKETQNIINITSNAGETEIQPDSKDKIIQDINLINELMDENKSKISSLQRKLGKGDKKNKDLQEMINFLNNQVTAKDAEIVILNNKLEALNIEVESLTASVDTLKTANIEKTKVIEEQTTEMNTAYYCYGTEKELREQGVLTKEGGFIGLGKSNMLKQDFNDKYFTKIDIREFKELILNVKKARLITIHPSGSYRYTGTTNLTEKIIISDYKKFWGASRYLVIVVE